jgi:hypothetical protein
MLHPTWPKCPRRRSSTAITGGAYHSRRDPEWAAGHLLRAVPHAHSSQRTRCPTGEKHGTARSLVATSSFFNPKASVWATWMVPQSNTYSLSDRTGSVRFRAGRAACPSSLLTIPKNRPYDVLVNPCRCKLIFADSKSTVSGIGAGLSPRIVLPYRF